MLAKCHYDSIASAKSASLSAAALNRRKKRRIIWSEINDRISDNHFRRMFRMNRNCFKLLCQKIISTVGESKFKSEEYIAAFLVNPYSPLSLQSAKIHNAHCYTSGGYISGEVKLAISLRLLAGGDAYDLAVMFDIGHRWCKQILYDVLNNWIVGINLGNIDIESYLNNEEEMNRVSRGFSKRSNGILQGAIGAIDGWLVKIIRPSITLDGIKNIVGFFSRKGFYALNCQVLVDHEKKVLWAKYENRGSSHDSSCFRDSGLYGLLQSKMDYLFNKGFFLLGDSAYAIESFIIPPYDSPLKKSQEDDFNFFHSSARITVECAFGEIDLRWGIFWKRLTSRLNNTVLIIEGAMHLHNFLVDYRNGVDCGEIDNEIDRNIFVEDMYDNGVFNIVVANDNIGRDAGRRSNLERTSRQNGHFIRDKLRNELRRHDMHRPTNSEWNYDAVDHIQRI